MEKVNVLGAGMTKFDKYLNRSLSFLGQEALSNALADSGIDISKIEAAYVGNAMAGAILGQESIRGQVVLSGTELEGLPVYNVENACASGSTAFHLAWMSIASGMYDVVLALGVEKLFHKDKMKTFNAFRGSTNVEALHSFPGKGNNDAQSMFMDVYAQEAREHMNKYGTTIETIAQVAVKNSFNGSLNPYAQYQQAKSLGEVMNSRMISDPIRLLMCSPIGDGAAAIILCSEKIAAQYSTKSIYVASSVVLSGKTKTSDDKDPAGTRTALKAYELAGIGANEVGVVEVHDGAAPGEIWAYEHLGLCSKGEGGNLLLSGETQIDGKIPVNPSGGLIAKGHPVGATGIAQIVELTWQMRGEARQRQIKNKPKVGLAYNNGGYLNGESAAISINILKS
ncbi:hypothetical protein BTR23_14770 [Alkalihalophilus pseudofirmus]|nr:hypothetical protein BTR23_14770 [Alkalihalophilus pseudofirmus]